MYRELCRQRRRWRSAMARTGRPTVALVLTDAERETLERWARRPKSAQVLALRCRIVLDAAPRRGGEAVAGPAGHGRGPGGRRAPSEPDGGGGRAVRR